MKPVDQTKFGKHGNCLMACIASILEIPFDTEWELHDNWWNECQTYVRKHGYYLSCIYANDQGTAPAGYSIATGDGPRGFLHCVVLLDGQIVHDPHPDKTGISNVRDFMYFVRLCRTTLPRRIQSVSE
jgi:hypothetical protein